MYLLEIWFTILIIGLAFYPITSSIFKNFHDKGWLFSKIIGICISSWFMWLLSYLKILKYTRLNAILVVILFTIINGIFLFIKYKKKKFSFKDIKFDFIAKIIITEVIFIFCLCFWSYIKGYNPSIETSTEKFMDYGYMNSLMNTEYMPAEDIWLSGKSINYYYFGQYISGFICKISGLTASEGYFYIIALIASFTFVLPASIGFNLFKNKQINKKNNIIFKVLPFIVAIFIGLAASVSGSLHYPLHRWILPDKENYTYVDETRYIGYKPEIDDKTATEVPAYSSIVGDLHAHYIDLIFSLSTVALLAQYFIDNEENKIDKKSNNKFKKPMFYILLTLIALMLGIQKMTNYWDFPIYIVIISATIIVKELICGKFNFNSIKNVLIALAYLFILEELITLPFTIDLVVNGTQICFTGIMSPFYKLFIKWGLPTLCAIGFLIIFLIKFKYSNEKFKDYLNNNLADLFVIIIAICAFGLVLLPEIIYLKDIYGDDYKRFNTMFKLTYQAFILFSISTSYILFRLTTYKQKYLITIGIILNLINMTTFFYGIDAIITCYSNVEHQDLSSYTTEKHIKDLLPEDFKAIEWIRNNVDRNKIIVESTKLGNSYSTSSRISTFTGNPTVIGWIYHEWIWRANKDYSIPQELNDRNNDVSNLYQAKDSVTARNIIDKYNIDYIYIGQLEYNTYKDINTKLLLSLGEKVFSSSDNYLIKVGK